MRKWVLLLLLILVLAFGSIYLFIPNNLSIQAEENVTANPKAFIRSIYKETTWQSIFSSEGDAADKNGLTYEGYQFSIVERRQSSLLIEMKANDKTILTELVFVPIGPDSIHLTWDSRLTPSSNPFAKATAYFEARRRQRVFNEVLQKIKTFFLEEKNAYGFTIIKDHVLDSTLISTSISSRQYPTTEMIYQLIDRLANYAMNNHARQTGLPMLHIKRDNDSSYLTRVALPVDKKLKDSGAIQYRWMLGGGNILVTEVKGGPSKINAAFTEMENYVSDHGRIAPAIPFQSLVTDRRKEPDSSKWTTKIYWPVM